MARPRREREAPEYAAFCRRVITSLGKRASGDPDALALLAELEAHLTATLAEAARACHEAGWSWTDLGQTLGVSRQAARQRWGTGPPGS